jgi:general secretion pathway protein M
MNATLPTGQAGRLLALGLTAIVVALLWLGVASPLIAWHDERAERLEQRQILADRMAMLARSLPSLREAAAQAAPPGSGAAASGSLLEGASDAVAAASLQQLVQDMATRSGATLASAETLPATQAGAYRRIGVHVALQATWPVLIHLLQSVAAASPRMLVDDLQLHATHSVQQPPDPPLGAGFTVYAFRAGEAGR